MLSPLVALWFEVFKLYKVDSIMASCEKDSYSHCRRASVLYLAYSCYVTAVVLVFLFLNFLPNAIGAVMWVCAEFVSWTLLSISFVLWLIHRKVTQKSYQEAMDSFEVLQATAGVFRAEMVRKIYRVKEDLRLVVPLEDDRDEFVFLHKKAQADGYHFSDEEQSEFDICLKRCQEALEVCQKRSATILTHRLNQYT